MPDISSLIREAELDGYFKTVANNPLAQFSFRQRRYLFSELLPEQTVGQNSFSHPFFRLRPVIASDSSQNAPSQLRRGDLFSKLQVELGYTNIRRELTGDDYNAIFGLVQQGNSYDAMQRILGWQNLVLNRPIIEKNELQRVQAIVNALIPQAGDNAFNNDVVYDNPVGHRIPAAAPWSIPTTNIFDEIHALVNFMTGKGFKPYRMITSQDVVSMMLTNDTVKASIIHQSMSSVGRVSLELLNQAFDSHGWPMIERYDLRYQTESGSERFLPNNVFVILGETEQEATIDKGDEEPMFLPNLLGFYALGKTSGQSEPGRIVNMKYENWNPPRIEGECVQAGIPVITEPEAIGVINAIT